MAGIIFFEMSWADITRTTVSRSITHNTSLLDNMFNRDIFYDWVSVGAASDSTTVTLEIDFGVARAFTYLFLKETNLKNFSLQYWNGSSWTTIFSEAANTSSFYQKTFSQVTAQKVRLLMNGTIVANQEKAVGEFILTKLIGQLVGYPEIDFNNDKNTISKAMLSGRYKTVSDGGSVKIKLNFKDYMGAADRALFATLFNKTEAFIVWLCGGDTTQFAYADEGYRLQDLYLVAIDDGYTHKFTKNLYSSGFNATISLSEQA